MNHFTAAAAGAASVVSVAGCGPGFVTTLSESRESLKDLNRMLREPRDLDRLSKQLEVLSDQLKNI